MYYDFLVKIPEEKGKISDIKADLEWYGNVYSKIGIKNRFEMNNDSPKTAVKRLIKEYGLSE